MSRAILAMLVSMLFIPVASTTHAATATSTGTLDMFSTAVTPGGTGTIWVDAISKRPTVTNATTTATLNTAPTPFVPGGTQTTYFWPFRGFWGPTVTSGVLTKALPFVSVMTTR